MISFFINALKIIFLLGFLIFIHESGHFLVAKLCKIKVKEFAIGFGPTIWKKQGKETKYALRLIPLGGFVNMLGEEERSEEKGSFSSASIPKRIAIVLAGGLVNIIFGLIVYFILMASIAQFYTTTIDNVLEGYVAEEQGIISNDKILEVNGKKVKFATDVVEKVQNSNGKELTIKIERNNETKYITLKPTQEENTYKIGITFKVSEKNFSNNIYYAFWDTVDFSTSIIDNLKELFTGKVSTEALMGPVGIAETVSKTQGFAEFIYMLALISLSLGVTNLLPFPPLDGGKAVILIIEAIRKKPIKEETEIKIQLLGFSLLIALSIYVTYNDILRIF